jgi:hypothetical protein
MGRGLSNHGPARGDKPLTACDPPKLTPGRGTPQAKNTPLGSWVLVTVRSGVRWERMVALCARGERCPPMRCCCTWRCVVTGLGVALAGALLFSNGHTAHVVSGGILFALRAAGVGLQGWHAVKELRGAVNSERRKVSVLSDGAAEPDFEKGDCVAIKGTGEEGPTSGAATSGEARFLSACLEPAAGIKMRAVSFPLAKVFLVAPPGPARRAGCPPDGPLLAPSAEGGPGCDSGDGPVSP